MIVLAIDPGYERLGIAVLKKEKGGDKLLHSSCFKTSKDLALNKRFNLIDSEIKKIIKKYKPSVLAIENLFFNNNQKTVMRVSEVRGIIINTSSSLGLLIREFTPLQVKVAVAGYGRASKKQIADMIPLLITMDNKKRVDDELDAIAVGLTCLATEKSIYNQ